MKLVNILFLNNHEFSKRASGLNGIQKGEEDMDVFEAIKTRRSVGVVSDKEVPKEMVEKILEAGIWAPTHFYTEPWRFFVITEDGRKPLGDLLAEIAKEGMDEPESESNQIKLEKVKRKPFRAPVIIVAAVEPSDNPKAILTEEYASVSAAVQNMLLAAHALGLGAIWRTGKVCYDARMRDFFGLSEKGEVLGFIYLGYPENEPREGKREPFTSKTEWLSDESDFEKIKSNN